MFSDYLVLREELPRSLFLSRSKPDEEPLRSLPDEEPLRVKKITFDGKKYLLSSSTGLVYDYEEYVNNQEQVVIGKWNETEKSVIFNKAHDSDEEQEEEYEM